MVIKTTSFYAPRKNFRNKKVFLSEDEAHHLINVLRAKKGDEFFVTNGEGSVFRCKLEKSFDKGAVAQILEPVEPNPQPSVDITIGVGAIQVRKLEFIIDCAVQIGITGFVPLVCSFSQIQLSDEKKYRFEKVAISAIKQCKRAWLPQILPPTEFHKFLQEYGTSFDGIVWADPDGVPSIPKRMVQEKTKLLALVGPEGGFSTIERQALMQYDAVPISLGPARLKTETASIVLITKILIWSQDI